MKKSIATKKAEEKVKNNKISHYNELRTPYNFVTFWPFIDSEYFSPLTEKNFYQISQTIQALSSKGNFCFP